MRDGNAAGGAEGERTADDSVPGRRWSGVSFLQAIGAFPNLGGTASVSTGGNDSPAAPGPAGVGELMRSVIDTQESLGRGPAEKRGGRDDDLPVHQNPFHGNTTTTTTHEQLMLERTRPPTTDGTLRVHGYTGSQGKHKGKGHKRKNAEREATHANANVALRKSTESPSEPSAADLTIQHFCGRLPTSTSDRIRKSVVALNGARAAVRNAKPLSREKSKGLLDKKGHVTCPRYQALLDLRKVTHVVADFAKLEAHVDELVAENIVGEVVLLLNLSNEYMEDGYLGSPIADVEKEACFILGLLAIKPEHQRAIADAGAIPLLVQLLHRHGIDLRPGCKVNIENRHPAEERKDKAVPALSGCSPSVARRASDAITNLAHENVGIKSRVRTEGGIPPLVALLHCADSKAQRAAAGALRTLAFKNDENKAEIVDCGALPTLIFMLSSDDPQIHYEAVGVIGNLVHSSSDIKKKVLVEGAVQPVIRLLSSTCGESKREAALLLGQFATTEENRRAIVQRGAIVPLIRMLEHVDNQLKEMAAFALGRLAQNHENQAGICAQGGLRPLLRLLESRSGNLQHNAAFALYGLADNEDNVADIILAGGVEQLLDGERLIQASRDCVSKTLKRLEEKTSGRVLDRLLYILHVSKRVVKEQVVIALANLASPEDLENVYVTHNAFELLFEMLMSRSPRHERLAAKALNTIAEKAHAGKETAVEVSPPSPTPNGRGNNEIYLGEQYVNSSTLSDIVFEVEGKKFYGHRIALLASSDAFRAMFDGEYIEKQASKIVIPNISFRVFEAMMRCIYTGTVKVEPDIARDLLEAADQYLLEGLKHLCEKAIADELDCSNFMDIYNFAEAYHAPELMHSVILFVLKNYEAVCDQLCFTAESFGQTMETMRKELRVLFVKAVKNAKNVEDNESMDPDATEDGRPDFEEMALRLDMEVDVEGMEALEEMELALQE